MPDSNTPANTEASSSAFAYFRTHIAGLSVVVGDPKEDDVAPQTVRFQPVHQRWDGEMQRFGYLKTNNKVAIKKLKADSNVVSIDADEYDKIMERADDASEPNVRRGTL